MDSPTPLFTVGQAIATFLVSYGIVSKAWDSLASYTESSKAWDFLASDTESFTVKEDKREGIAYVAFPSFHNIKDFDVKETKDGEGNIQTDNKVFSDFLKGNDDKPALLHQGALKMFLHILKNTDFKERLEVYTDWNQKKLHIIFVGHSFGGAVATLATLWVLGKRLRKSSPFCITFGCPSVGDVRLVEAVGRENWAGNFCNLISRYDIVPRMLLAPIESIVKPLSVILPYWQDIVPYSFVQDACRTLLNNVLDFLNESDGAMERSPSRPFGTCIFCSTNGATCIDNSETVLEVLRWTIQSLETSSDEIVEHCFSEHIGYGSVLTYVIKRSISESASANLDSESSYEMGISLQLEAIGVRSQNDHIRNALKKAGNIGNLYDTNVAELTTELIDAQCFMAELEWYKERCEKEENGYYESLKKIIDKKDFRANVLREKLAGFWDKIVEMWDSHELPSDFQSRNKWINAGNTYRRLVEPLDIEDYYRRSNGNGNYISDGRPSRHKVLQKWKEEKDKTRSSRAQKPRTKFASLLEDSCFWAHVEEALKELKNLKDMKNLKQAQHERLESLEEFEDTVITMINYCSISTDVFLKGSSFMMWWEEWTEYNKSQCPEWTSPLCDIIPVT